MVLKIKVSVEPFLLSVVVLMRGCSGTGEYDIGKEKITVCSLQKTRLHHWSRADVVLSYQDSEMLTILASGDRRLWLGSRPPGEICCNPEWLVDMALLLWWLIVVEELTSPGPCWLYRIPVEGESKTENGQI